MQTVYAYTVSYLPYHCTTSESVPSVQMIDPMTMSRVTHDEVVLKWGVSADKLGDVLALAGDSADNIPGVPGIGPKIAAELIDTFGTLDNLLDNVEAVKQKGRREKLKSNADQARLSRVLVELDRNIPFDRMKFPDGVEKVSDLRMELMDPNGLSQFFGGMGLRDLKMRFDKRLQMQRGVQVAPQKQDRSKFASRPRADVPKPEDFRDVPF
jgi:DNA polymerase I